MTANTPGIQITTSHFGGSIATANTHTWNPQYGGVISANSGPPQPGRTTSFSESTMVLADLRTGEIWNVVSWSIIHNWSTDRDEWNFTLRGAVNPPLDNWQVVLPPESVEAYLLPGTIGPRTNEDRYRYPNPPLPGQPAQGTAAPPTSKEDDMLRKTFTFTYTGEEIAAAIDAQIADLEANIAVVESVNLDALRKAGLATRADAIDVDSRLKALNGQITAKEAEKRPYAKDGKKEFELDAEDVDHFGL